jgi:HK97 family phage prohead protease
MVRVAEKIQQKRTELEIRKFAFEYRAEQIGDTQELYVEGYAVIFDQPTVLFEMGGVEYKEVIDRNAFSKTNMTDVIFNYNHSGKVMARTRNNTLTLIKDDRGLFIRARLDGTEEGRKIYEEIRGGYIDRMSFQFTIAEKGETFDKENRTFTVKDVKKLYDVSAVDIPAYDTTSISARSFLEAAAEKERKALVSAELRKKLVLQTYL